MGMSKVFVGVIVVAIVGNAAEHSTAILAALKDRLDLSLGIAIVSSIQISLFVAPLLVVLSYAIAAQPMDLVFTRGEVLVVVLAAFILQQIAVDGKSTWFKGVQLLAVYAIIAVAFYFIPSIESWERGVSRRWDSAFTSHFSLNPCTCLLEV